MVTAMVRVNWREGLDEATHMASNINLLLSRRVKELYNSVFSDVCVKVRHLAPCTVCAIKAQLDMPSPDALELLVTGMVVRQSFPLKQHSTGTGTGTGSSATPLASPYDVLVSNTPPTFVPKLLPSFLANQVLATARAFYARQQCTAQRIAAAGTELEATTRVNSNPFFGAVAGAGTGTSFSSSLGLLTVSVDPDLDTGHDGDAVGGLNRVDGAGAGAGAGAAAHPGASSSGGPGSAAGSPVSGATPNDGTTPSPSQRPPRPAGSRSYASASASASMSALSPSLRPMRRTERTLSMSSTNPPAPTHFSASIPSVVFTPLHTVAGHRITRYCGWVNLHFIRESVAVRQGGGLSSFFVLLLSEAHAVIRAHVQSLGGNAVLGFRLTPLESGQTNRNQAYHMVSVSGDAAFIEPAV